MALQSMSGLSNLMLSEITQAAPGSSAAGVLNGCKVGLFTNTPVVTSHTLLADLTAPTDAWYALSTAVTWGAIYNEADGTATLASNLVPFIASGTVTGSSIKGYYLVAGSGSPTAPLAIEVFAAPVILATVGVGFNLVVNIEIDSSSIGESTVIS